MPHFEIHATDVERAKAFYAGLFGWSFAPMQGAEEIGYRLNEGDEIGGRNALPVGLMRRIAGAPAPGSPIRGGTMTFAVEDCDASYAWALAHGGAEALPPTDHTGIGPAADVEDGEGNVVGMITPAEGEN